MKGKYMKIKRVVLSTLTVVMIASQLCGCAAVSKDELEEMIGETETVTIETAEPLIVGDRESREDETETTEVTEAESKTIEDLVKEVAKIAGFTDEEVESIVEDARVYEAYGSSAEIAADMAIKDAVYGKSNGQQDYAVTLPQVVDENGNPYPTDEYGGVIVPETTAPEETTQVAKNETPTATVSEEGKELTYEYTDEQLDYTLKVYGDDEVFVVIENDTGEVHKYDNLTEYRNYHYNRDSEKRRDPDLIEWDGKLNTEEDLAMTNEELRQLIDSGYNFGYIH